MEGKTKVAVYHSNSDIRIEERDIPKVGDRELLIQISASGICGTDLMEWYRIKRGPRVLGHEIAGEIVEIGKDITEYEIGDRVFATHHVPCGECEDCNNKNPTQCKEFQDVNNFEPGGFSEYVKVSGGSVEKGILHLPDNVSYNEGTFIEPLGTVVEAFGKQEEALRVIQGKTVLVLGSGIAGCLNIKYAKAFRAEKIIATDINPKRLEYARKFGADYTFRAKNYDPDRTKGANKGRLADLVIICAAAKSVMEQALDSCGNGGKVIIFATPKEGEEVSVDFFKKWRTGFTWHPTYGASPKSCKEALSLIENRGIRVDNMITHTLSLDDITDGFRVANKGEGLKVVIKPNGLDFN